MTIRKEHRTDMPLIHCSFETVEDFYPRIPLQRCPGEDDSIPRICVADSVNNALNAMPQAAEVLDTMERIRVPLILHVYYLESSNVMNSVMVQKYVPDALATHEKRILSRPDSIVHRVIKITHWLKESQTDPHGKIHLVIKELNYEFLEDEREYDNWCILAGIDDTADIKMERIRATGISYRTFLSNLNEDGIHQIRTIRNSNRAKKNMRDTERYLFFYNVNVRY